MLSRKKFILLGFMTLFILAQAKMVDGIALVVEGEAITTSEIRVVQRQNGISKSKAIDMLILNRLQKSAMKEVTVSEDEVDAKVSAIAAQNSVSIVQMQKILKKQGTSWARYRDSIRNAMKREKFYKEKVIDSMPAPSDDELEIFYKNHKSEFTIPSAIGVVEYTSESKEDMENFVRTHNKKYVKAKSITKKTKGLNEALLSMLLQTKVGGYTKSLNAGDKYIVYKVRSKKGKTSMPFEAAKPAVAATWKQQQQGSALRDYFKKLRTKADIEIIR